MSRKAYFSSDKIISSLLPSLSFSMSLLFFAPCDMLFRNYLYFYFTAADLLLPLLTLTVLLCAVLMAILVLLPESVRRIAAAVLAAFSVLVWVQGNIIVWSCGTLNGTLIKWDMKWYYGVIDLGIWVLVIAASVYFSSRLYKNIRTIVPVLLLIFFMNSLLLFLGLPRSPNYKKYEMDFSHEFDFSSSSNIILVILDKFRSDVFWDIIGEQPSYAEPFDGFTYFRNSTASYSYTYAAITGLLTSQYYDNSIPMQTFMKKAYHSASSIPKVLSGQGYRVEVYPCRLECIIGLEKAYYYDPAIVSNVVHRNKYPILTSFGFLYLLDLSLFRSVPYYIKKKIYRNGRWLLAFDAYRDEVRKNISACPVSDRRFPPEMLEYSHDLRFIQKMLLNSRKTQPGKVFKMIHLQGPHPPLSLNAEFRKTMGATPAELYSDQAKASLRIVELFLGKLKEIGVYDDSLIIVMGDHGAGDPGFVSKKYDGYSDRKFIGRISAGMPLLLVKRRGERGLMKKSDAPVSLSDISPTIFKNEGIDAAGGGNDIFTAGASGSRKRIYYWFDYEGNSHWNSQYLPPLHEYAIDGFSWDPASWKRTGRVFLPPE